MTVLLTSHNLAEVEELCERVAIITKGSIRALDTPQTLRSLHTRAEQATITFNSLVAGDAERALAQAFGRQFFTLERGARDDDGVIKFSRASDDELLHSVLRVLQESGGIVRSVESERATLFDVLESYEK